jgi:hypothetical protein
MSRDLEPVEPLVARNVRVIGVEEAARRDREQRWAAWHAGGRQIADALRREGEAFGWIQPR